ncbi:MAG TPA: DUF6644 family protein [Steroidobacteraceae bacterium]|jgi:hypothetical protein
MLDSALQHLQDTQIATAIREGGSLFPWIECVHVLALTLVIGSIAIVDLRLLGLRYRDRSVLETTAEALPVTWTAFALALLTGGLMFSSNAIAYAHNSFFQAKIALIAFAGLNMLGYHLVVGRGAASWHTAALTPLRARLVGGVSLALWIAVAACGRWIGFTINGPT